MKRIKLIFNISGAALMLFNIVLGLAGIILQSTVCYGLVLASCVCFAAGLFFSARIAKKEEKVSAVSIILGIFFCLFALWQSACFFSLL